MAKPHTCRLVPKAVAKTCCLGVRFGWEKKIPTPGEGQKAVFFFVPFFCLSKFYFGWGTRSSTFFPGKRCPFFFSFFSRYLQSSEFCWKVLRGIHQAKSSKTNKTRNALSRTPSPVGAIARNEGSSTHRNSITLTNERRESLKALVLASIQQHRHITQRRRRAVPSTRGLFDTPNTTIMRETINLIPRGAQFRRGEIKPTRILHLQYSPSQGATRAGGVAPPSQRLYWCPLAQPTHVLRDLVGSYTIEIMPSFNCKCSQVCLLTHLFLL